MESNTEAAAHHTAADARTLKLCIKRCLDVVLSLVALVLLLPLVALTATLLWTTSTGPVLSRHERVGRDGRRFHLLELRSMPPGADGHDVDRCFRRLGISELPQLWNVIRGDMSLVGPQPLPSHEVDIGDPRQRERLAVPPGLTGAWRSIGPAQVDPARLLESDLAYVRSWSLRLDVTLLLRSIPVVFAGRGRASVSQSRWTP